MRGNVEFFMADGYPVPTGNTLGAETIADWLGNDIQYNSGGVDEWLGVFADVAEGKREGGYQGTGNSHSVMVMSGLVYLECEYVDEQKVLITLEQASTALANYKNFLQRDYKSGTTRAKPFEVEYEAEGQDALDRYIETGGTLGEPI